MVSRLHYGTVLLFLAVTYHKSDCRHKQSNWPDWLTWSDQPNLTDPTQSIWPDLTDRPNQPEWPNWTEPIICTGPSPTPPPLPFPPVSTNNWTVPRLSPLPPPPYLSPLPLTGLSQDSSCISIHFHIYF